MSKDKKQKGVIEELIFELIENLAKVIQYFVDNGLRNIIQRIVDAIREGSFKRLFSSYDGSISAKDIKRFRLPQNVPDGHFGYLPKEKRFFPFNELDTSKHTLVVGATGSGKSNIIYGLMEKAGYENRPVVLFDPKGALEELNNTRECSSAQKRKTYYFDPHYKGPNKIHINPFKTMDEKTIATNLVDIFIYSNEYYKNAAKTSITEVVWVIRNIKIEEWRPQHFELQKAMKERFGNKDLTVTLKKIHFGLVFLYEQSDRHIGIIGNISDLVNGDLGEMLSENVMLETKSLHEIIDENAWVYIGINKLKYGSEALQVAKLFFQEMLYIAGDRLQKSINPKMDYKPATLIIEEFSSIVTYQLPELTSKARSAGLEVVLAQQSLSDSDNVQGIQSLQSIIMDHVGAIFIGRQFSPRNAELLSSLVGTQETIKMTKQTDGNQETDKGSQREVKEFLVHPSRIKELPMGAFIVVNMKRNMKTVHFLGLKNFKYGEQNYIKSKSELLSIANEKTETKQPFSNNLAGTFNESSKVTIQELTTTKKNKLAKNIDPNQIEIFEV